MSKPVVVITGANGGIGSSLCTVFADRGWQVVASDIDKSAAALADQYVPIDLDLICTDDDYKSRCVSLLREAAPQGLNCLINNAASQIIAPIEEMTSKDLQHSFNVNVIAPYLLVQGLIEKLESAGGSVINIASIHAHLTKPGFSAYAASKSALEGLTRAMAVELGSRVRVNAIAPAAILTPMLEAGFDGNKGGLSNLAQHHPANRIGDPEEVAKLALFMADSDSPFLNGAIVGLDGGIASRLHCQD